MKTATPTAPLRSDADYQNEIDRLLAEMDAMHRENRAGFSRFERQHEQIMKTLDETVAMLRIQGIK